MRMLAAGSKFRSNPQGKLNQGFSLVELMIVVAIMAIATAGVGLAIRDSSAPMLEREAERLGALLESARAQSRMAGVPVRWRSTADGFAFEGLATFSMLDPAAEKMPSTWLSTDVRAVASQTGLMGTTGTAASALPVLILGPEPVIGPQQVRLVSISAPSQSLLLATDGVRPFAVVPSDAALPTQP